MTARALYQNACTFKLAGRLCMAANDVPDVAPADAVQTLDYFQCPRVFVPPLEAVPTYMIVPTQRFPVESHLPRSLFTGQSAQLVTRITSRDAELDDGDEDISAAKHQLVTGARERKAPIAGLAKEITAIRGFQVYITLSCIVRL